MIVTPELVKTIKRMIVPFRRNFVEDEYARGWNDAIKEANKHFAKYLKPWMKELEKTL